MAQDVVLKPYGDVLMATNSGSKVLTELRENKTLRPGFEKELDAIHYHTWYKHKGRANDLGFLLDESVPVGQAVAMLDYDDKGGLHGGTLMAFIERYCKKVFK